MKSDIVKPIAPSMPAPRMCFHSTPPGSSDKPRRTATHVIAVMPSGFPMRSPKKMPSVTGSSRECAQLVVDEPHASVCEGEQGKHEERGPRVERVLDALQRGR